MNLTGKHNNNNNSAVVSDYTDNEGVILPVSQKLSKREQRFYDSILDGFDNIIKKSTEFLYSEEYTQLRRVTYTKNYKIKSEDTSFLGPEFRHSDELKELFDSTEFKKELNNIIDENIQSCEDFIKEFYVVGAKLGYKQLKKQMGLTLADSEALYTLQKYEFGLIRNLNEELCVGIREVIFNAVATGQSTQTTTQRLLELPLEPLTYTNFRNGKFVKTKISSRRRAEMIARTEHARAVNTGTLQAYENYGVTEVEIITAFDSKVCNYCMDLEANNPYPLKDAQRLLPAHPNCYMPDTLIATQYGWKLFTDLNSDDRILSFNPENNSIDFLEYVQLIGHYNIFRYMYHIYNDDIDMCITPDHNCFVYQNGKPCFMKPWELNNDSKFLISYNNLGDKEFVNFTDCFVEKIDYTGMVYCVELPKYHTLWTKRNDKASWNGNCRCSYGPVADTLLLEPKNNPNVVDLTIDAPTPIDF